MLTRRHFGLLATGLATAPALIGRAVAQAADQFPAAGKRPWAEQVPTLRIGLLGGENDADRLARFEGYRKLLETTFEVPVKVFPAADYAGVIQAFAAKQIEMSSMGSSGYAGAWIETKGGVEPLLVPIETDGSISYRSVLVVRADSGIDSLEKMKGKSLAWADPNSTSGYLIPRFELKQAGIDPEPGKYFSKTGFGGGHEQAVVAVLQKQYDGACTWASGIGEEAKGFTRGNLKSMMDKGLLKPGELRIIWTSRPILNGPLTVRTDLPDGFKQDMIAFHQGMAAKYPEIYSQVERGGGKGYQRVTHADFQLFVDLRNDEAAQRRKRS